MHSTVNIIHFSYFDPDCPTTGSTVTQFARFYCNVRTSIPWSKFRIFNGRWYTEWPLSSEQLDQAGHYDHNCIKWSLKITNMLLNHRGCNWVRCHWLCEDANPAIVRSDWEAGGLHVGLQAHWSVSADIHPPIWLARFLIRGHTNWGL
jgi:hypothetical protein